MWTNDLLLALERIYEKFGYTLTIDKIENRHIYLSNHEIYEFDNDGNIKLIYKG